MKNLLVLAALLCVCSTASATLIVSVDPGVDAGGGLTAYTVHLISDVNADRVTAWEGAVSANAHQVWGFDGTDMTPTMGKLGAAPTYRPLYGACVLTPAERLQDTHVLLFDAQLIASEKFGMPFEENSLTEAGATAGAGSMYGYTAVPTPLMAFGIGTPVLNLSLIQIVVPNGQQVTLTGSAVNATGDRFATNVSVPEPATMCLLAFGSIGMLIRRRRR